MKNIKLSGQVRTKLGMELLMDNLANKMFMHAI
jgi:hypothetical protein